MKRLFLLWCCILLIQSISCQKENIEVPTSDIELNLKSSEIIEADNQFGTELFNLIIDEETEAPNLMISPLSVSLALAMAYNGAEGETKKQMEEVLHKNGITADEINQSYKSLVNALESHDPKVELSIANSIFYNKGYSFKQEFMQTNQSYYDAEIQELDFSNSNLTLETVNNWVKNKTKNKIESILDQVSPYDVLYLINAIYFKGEWTYQFDTDDTQDRPFYTESNSELSVPTMRIEETFNYTSENEFEALELPYGSGKYSMLILLPNEGHTVNEVAGLITADNISTWTNEMNEVEKTVYLPKFEFAYQNSLVDNLKALGMLDAFSTTDADFSDITDVFIYISDVLHKSYIKVDEEGTEAAAVTGITFEITSVGPNQDFIVDHPFAFAIREKDTNAILFVGKVSNPLDKGE